MEIYDVNNLSSILFYTGEYANNAALITENRKYGAYVSGLGYLTKTSDALTSWTGKTNIKFEETTPNFTKLGDIYKVANSYAAKYYDNYTESAVTIANNRYNANYSYEGDLNNDFSTANAITASDLKTFLLSMNEQIFNKQKYYGDAVEVNDITIGPTVFKWYPIDSVAYVRTDITSYDAYTYEWAESTMESETAYTEAYTASDIDLLHSYYYTTTDADNNTQYMKAEVSYSYSYIAYDVSYVPYKIGGNYYSYTKQTYNTIDDTLYSNIKTYLDAFAVKYDPSMYAYYIYDCGADLSMTINSNSVGKKKSVFQIRFDSIYNKWFSYDININANITDESEGDDLNTPANLFTITSATDNAIFSARLNESTAIGEENILLNKDEKHTFTTNKKVVDGSVISMLTPYEAKIIDFSPMKSVITGILDLTETKWNITKGCKLEQLIMSNDDTKNTTLTRILGLNELTTVKYVNIENYEGLTATPSILTLADLKVYKAKGSTTTNFKPAANAVLNYVSLPDNLKLIRMIGVKFEAGTVNINGEDVDFDGTFDYTPSDKLKSVTMNDITGLNTYRFIYNWRNSITNLTEGVYYLDLTGFNWNNAPIDFVLDLRKFDINQLSGTIKIKGTGNYGWISRSDYQSIIRAYGLNALADKTDTNKRDNKLFPELFLTTKGKETFEYTLTVKDVSLAKYQETLTSKDTKYDETLTVTIDDTRAGNAFLDLFVEFDETTTEAPTEEPTTTEAPTTTSTATTTTTEGPTTYDVINGLDFIWDSFENYAYCSLSTSIDTKNSDEVSTIKAGDIMLYNGNTVMIFAKDVKNTIYEYVKIGHITDVTVGKSNTATSTIQQWLSKFAQSTLQFIPSHRPIVVSEITVTGSNYMYDNGDDSELTLSITVDHPEAENNRIVLDYDTNVLDVTLDGEDVEEGANYTYPRIYKIKSHDKHIVTSKISTSITFASEINTVDTANEYSIDIIQYNEPSSVSTTEDGKNILALNNAQYHVTDDGVLVISKGAASIDEATHTLTIE